MGGKEQKGGETVERTMKKRAGLEYIYIYVYKYIYLYARATEGGDGKGRHRGC